MTRALVLALLVANLCFWAWTQGWLDNVVGARAGGDREPERLGRQVRPETVRILPPAPAASAASAADDAASAPAAAARVACLEAGPFATQAALAAAEKALQAALPALARERWADVKTDQPGAWLVYMGKYPNHDALVKKEEELKRRRVDYAEVQGNPSLEPGLALGRYEERGAADKALAQLVQQGVRTAHVVEVSAPSSTHRLRVDKADAELASRLGALKAEAFGKGFVACADSGPAGAGSAPAAASGVGR